MTSESRITETDIWAVLDEMVPKHEPRPANSATARELAAKNGISRNHAAKLLRDAVESGRLRAIPCRSANGKVENCYVPA